MPKIETRGVGLMQRKVEIINAEVDPEAFKRALEEWASRSSADAWREANAKHVRESLEKAASKRGMDVKQFVATLAEDQAYRIFWDWLCVYNRLARERAKPEPDIALAVEHAEELGRIQERLYWRAGVDPETRERREALALQGKATRKGGRKGHEAAHGTEDEKQERWRSMAAAFDEEYARLGAGRRKIAAYDIVAERFRVDRSTVIRALRRNL